MVALNRESLQEKILDGQRISAADALELYRWPLAELGALADARRDLAKEKHYGNRGLEIVTYIVDRNINYTNVCNVYCKFCAFYRTERDDDHYVLTREQFDIADHRHTRLVGMLDHAMGLGMGQRHAGRQHQGGDLFPRPFTPGHDLGAFLAAKIAGGQGRQGTPTT